MSYPMVLELDAEGIPVRLTCGVLGFSPQAFSTWRVRSCSSRDLDDAHLTNALVDLHAEDPAFGYRFLADELVAGGYEDLTRFQASLIERLVRHDDRLHPVAVADPA